MYAILAFLSAIGFNTTHTCQIWLNCDNIYLFQEFSIDILPLDDGSPVIEVNIGLQFLEYTGSEISNIISANELRATDTDTPADKIMYVITDAPQLGRLEKTDKPGTGILSFSQGTLLSF